jgi:C4-dicarboxylate-specific signal transduction histidine kinase
MITFLDHRAQEARARLLHSQKMEAVGTLAGGVAHDFNNILTAHRRGDMLRVKLGDSPLVGNVDNLLEAAQRAAQLTGICFHVAVARRRLSTSTRSSRKSASSSRG